MTGRRDFELYGSGRTDAGVHARAQVAHLDVVTSLPAAALTHRLNDELPADINILRVENAGRRFHARHDAVARRYVYQIARRRTAFAKAFVWWVKEPIETESMKRAASAFIGMRDFRSFTVAPDLPEPGDEGDKPRSTLVLVERLDIVESGPLVLVGIEGSHFLWKMVRRLVGVLVEIGRGRLEASAAASFLADASNQPARLTAPASGLFLDHVYYGNEPRESELRAITPIG